MIEFFKQSPYQKSEIHFEKNPDKVCVVYNNCKYVYYSAYFSWLDQPKMELPLSLNKEDAEFWACFLDRKYKEVRVYEKDGLYCVIGMNL